MTAAEIFDVTGKVALVTGAAAGLGQAIAQTLAENGARLVCFDLDRTALSDTCKALRKTGAEVIGIAGDVTQPDRIEDAINRTVERFGRLDIAIANAGISDRTSDLLHQTDPQDVQRVIDVNLSGVINLNRAALRQMMIQKAGKVINVASMWGLAGPAGLFARPAYAASKGAVVNLTRELGLEYAPFGIQVNALCPGFFRTQTRPRTADQEQIMADYTPMQRIAEASEISGSILYLASSASDFVTGTTLVIDGGVLAK
jgi:NAD(P)-dependent dehydrogenase (short-subunit alcohol dehydrogenase family)